MEKFYNNAMALGFTLEMIFRGADIEGTQVVKLD
jgi:hypothetical protein